MLDGDQLGAIYAAFCVSGKDESDRCTACSGVRYRVDMQGWRALRRASGDDVMEDALTCWNTATYNCTLEQKGYKMAIHSGVQPEVLRSYGERI